MPRNGSGTYTLPAGNPVVTGTVISSTVQNNTTSDIATALTQSIATDGQTVPTANLPMGGFKHTNVSDATALTQYLTAGQAVNSTAQYLQTVSGADTITASGTFTPGSYAAGQTYRFIAAGSNTTAVTLNVASLGAKDVKKRAAGGLVALTAKDLISGVEYSVTYDGTQFVLNEQRPYSQGADIASAGTINLDTATGDYVHITGTTAITAVTLAQGEQRTIVFDGILTFTNGANLLLPGSANITTAAGDVAVLRGEASSVVRCVNYVKKDGTAVVVATPTVTPAVPQTVLSGPVDTSGYSAFGGSTGSTTVTASGTLIATAANGTSNRIGTIVNPSWTSLSTNGTMYLYLDIASDGTCTTGSTTLAPTYRWGGADVTTNNQNTFNIQEMQMKVGNGATASQVWRVFVGQVTVAGAVVTAITWYALMGRYISANFGLATGTVYSQNHNLGLNTGVYTKTKLVCTTTDLNWAVGDVIDFTSAAGNYQNGYGVLTGLSASGLAVSVITASNIQVLNKSTAANTAITAASWRLVVEVTRGW